MNRRLSWQLAFMMLGLASAADAETAEPGCRAAYGDIWGEERPGDAIREIDGTGIRSLSDLTAAIGKPAEGVTRIKGGDFSGWDFGDVPLSGVCFEESKLAGANFSQVKAPGAGFIKADLTGAHMAGASMTEILVERGKDGLYTIEGRAVGANAHLCSLSASHLYFDKASGWYIPVSEGPAIPIFRIFDDRLEIFASGKPVYGKYPEADEFMSCGMRASFPETFRINPGPDLIESYRKSLSEEM